ncbi:MAG: leucine--tRNA ligase [Candidatus Paraimprobicoccus trichonymphae]|uniref:Leucine--tRNA ligase n=1 Tax=Candidatus Paraimprobicoccus trichonymphae TaxID=3033793 RepID=A0AA48IHL6_9FIRM|nr:MAG: leucine--tRNA ligase [Candidatus Paraimprobicoccus trichonymphae]
MYDFKNIESKWQKIWEKDKSFKADNLDLNKKKFYALIEFPYPSGEGLHVGHLRSYTALDIVSRKKRLQGYNVLYPIGWDAFGLPTENFAIKNKIHPKIVTEKNISRFKKQLKSMGFSFDWNREVNTTDPEYYKFTQWIFLKLFEKNLAYKSESKVNWCNFCKCVLANEEVVNKRCERCNNEVVYKNKSQWMLKITAYAERLIKDLDLVNYPERVKIQQKNWIGKSIGAEINFETSINQSIKVYTTRPETIFGATYLIISPEYGFINVNKNNIKNFEEVEKYVLESGKKTDLERSDLSREKTGVKLEGIFAINPVNKKNIDIYVSDYVLVNYGTGAVMAVPAHDERDFEFVKKFNLESIEVINKNKLINSEFLNGLDITEAQKEIINYLEKNKIGNSKINYRLRDWVFSRQRYWGEPVPIIICENCGYIALKESDLPLKLPDIENYETDDFGNSPLANIKNWVDVNCPKCGKKAKRETDTMPQWAGSSWYFLRYINPENKNLISEKNLLNYWLPVDWYNGGMEHTTLHLLYSRFWHKFLYDIGIVSCAEPYKKRTSHGMILGENNEKMSKSRGNVVNPDNMIQEFGADTMRLFEMFIGDFEKPVPWSSSSIKGCQRFLDRFYNLKDMISDKKNSELEIDFNQTIKKVSKDIENLKFNTAIAALMTLTNKIYELNSLTISQFKTFCILLNPFAPHITEELWEILKLDSRKISDQNWPCFNEDLCSKLTQEIVIQINGKLRAKITVPSGLDKNYIINESKKNPNILKYLENKNILKEIYVEDKLVNFVI